MEMTEDKMHAQTLHNRVILVWNDHSRQQAMFLNNSNVPVFRSTPACNWCTSFEAIYDLTQNEPHIFQPHVIPPDNDNTASTNIEPLDDSYFNEVLPRHLPVYHVKKKDG